MCVNVVTTIAMFTIVRYFNVSVHINATESTLGSTISAVDTIYAFDN